MIPKTLIDDDLNSQIILHAYRGSIAHGMFVPSNMPNSIDDKDTMGVVIPPLNTFFGLTDFGSRGTREIKEGEWDIVLYDIRKVVLLLMQGNPNVLSLLWVPENYVISQNAQGKLLRANKGLFVGRHVYKPFVGYATAQLYKMENMAFEGYMGDKRKRLVEKFGYDTKNAAHLIRILRMGIEFLRDGYLRVDRGNFDAVELLRIKNGEWSLEKVKSEADRLFERAERVYDNSTLPVGPMTDDIEELIVTLVEMEMVRRGELKAASIEFYPPGPNGELYAR